MGLGPGTRVDRFRLLECLGEGGQGSVWRAEDPLAPTGFVALKLVRMGSATPALARLDHPSLVKCHGMFEDFPTETLGLVLDLVAGRALSDAIEDPRWSSTLVPVVLSHVAHALGYLHSRGIVHRDLKLDNVLVDDSFWANPDRPAGIKLVDFGIAAVMGAPSGLTAVGHIVGTPAFMAPESLDPAYHGAGVPTAAADVFSFGVCGWILVFGEHPTGLPASSSAIDLAAAYRGIVSSAPRWSERATGAPLERLLVACVSPSPRDRLPHGEALAELCAEVLAGTDPSLGRWLAAPTAYSAPPSRHTKTMTDAHAVAIRGGRGETAKGPAPAPPSVLMAERHAATAPAGRPGAGFARHGMFAVALLGAFVVGALLVFAVLRSEGLDAPPAGGQPNGASSGLPAAASAPAAFAGPATANRDTTASLPTGCAPGSELCACCPAGHDCGPGTCKSTLGTRERFELRLWTVIAPSWKPPMFTDPAVRVCVTRTADPARKVCTRLRETLGGALTKPLLITTRDLTKDGLYLDLEGNGWRSHKVGRHAEGVYRSALCYGLDFGGFDQPRVEYVRFRVTPVGGPEAQACQSVANVNAGAEKHAKCGDVSPSGRCYCHLKNGYYGWAKLLCDQAREITPPFAPERASVEYNAAMAEQALGNLATARMFYRQSLALRPHREVQAALDNLDKP